MRLLGITLSTFFFFFFAVSTATAGCWFASTATVPITHTSKTLSVPLAVNSISVIPDAATGSIVYKQTIELSSGHALKCDLKGTIQKFWGYSTLPKPEIGTTKVYETGVAGIGVQFFYSSTTPFPFTQQYNPCSGTVATPCTTSFATGSGTQYIQFIKTGNTSGGIISKDNMPTGLYQVGLPGEMLNLYQLQISTDLTVNVPTCEINSVSKSMVVQLGSHDISEFGSPGTGSDWKNTSIQLNHCGWFYGSSAQSVATFDGTANKNIKSLTKNRAEITLTPLDGAYDAANGIMNIADHLLKANGVAIQLSRNENESGKINLDEVYSYTLPNDGSDTITVPLYARYIQTESAVSPGRANGKLMFTVSYH